MKEVANGFPIPVKEERNIKRISFRGFVSDAIGAFNIERGLVYTFKLLFNRPGYLVRLYLNEGRFKIFNPFRMLLLTTGLSLFLLYIVGLDGMFGNFSEGWDNYDDSQQKIDPVEFQQFFLDWYNLILWIAIPIYGLFSYLFNRKAGYNYAEHMVVQTFHVCALNVISILGAVLGLVISSDFVLIALLCASLCYYFWLISSWLGQTRGLFFVKNILAYALANLIYITVISLGTAIYLVTHGGL